MKKEREIFLINIHRNGFQKPQQPVRKKPGRREGLMSWGQNVQVLVGAGGQRGGLTTFLTDKGLILRIYKEYE